MDDVEAKQQKWTFSDEKCNKRPKHLSVSIQFDLKGKGSAQNGLFYVK